MDRRGFLISLPFRQGILRILLAEACHIDRAEWIKEATSSSTTEEMIRPGVLDYVHNFTALFGFYLIRSTWNVPPYRPDCDRQPEAACKSKDYNAKHFTRAIPLHHLQFPLHTDRPHDVDPLNTHLPPFAKSFESFGAYNVANFPPALAGGDAAMCEN